MRNTTGMMMAVMALMMAVPAWAQQQAQPSPVFVQTVTTQTISDKIEALGTLKANEQVDLTVNVSETVTDIHFDDGERVEKGDVLVEMTSGEEKALLQEAQASVDEAQKQYDRVVPLVKKKAASEALLDERERNLATTKAQLAAVVSRMDDLVVTAPFDGVVGLRDISVGALVSPGDRITTLVDDSQMKLDFAVPSLFLKTLKPGLSIAAKTPIYPERVFEGTIASVNNEIDPVTRSISVRAIIPNDEHLLKPGLLMSVNLFKDRRDALVINEEALISQADTHFVYRVKQGGEDTVAEKVIVNIGARYPGIVEITEGLSAGDKVVVHGGMKIQDGKPISIKSEIDEDTDIPALLSADEKATQDTSE